MRNGGKLPGMAILFLCAACARVAGVADQPGAGGPWIPDLGNGQFKNPVLFADYSDPDAIRVGEDYYLTASSFHHAPGLPILHSRDLVNWTIIGHVFQRQPDPAFDTPQHGKGVWAPAIRHHDGLFYVCYGDPDRGIMMATAKDPAGPWTGPKLIRPARGWIDACPFWDDDGQAYLVHAWAKSRAGFNSVLTINRLSPDGMRVLDEGELVFDGHERHPTIEGPKLYKRQGYYYIFAPAGGVGPGWQTVLRSRKILGPYEDKVVLERGSTPVNGPHQGGWIETPGGEHWFMHFQDRGAYGRIVHLQPMRWVDDWPVMGIDLDGNGIGEPVATFKKPDVGRSFPIQTPQTSDAFEGGKLGLQWQWQANGRPEWFSLATRPGWLRLHAEATTAGATNLWPAANILTQKMPAPDFTMTTRMDFSGLKPGEKAGLTVFGMDYAYVAVGAAADGFELLRATGRKAEAGQPEKVDAAGAVASGPVWLRVTVKDNQGPLCVFSTSSDGKTFQPLGEAFRAREGRWVGATVGLFCVAAPGSRGQGHADFEWVAVE